MQNHPTKPNYESYTEAELLDVYNNIDKERFPDRYAQVCNLLGIEQEEISSSFNSKSEVTVNPSHASGVNQSTNSTLSEGSLEEIRKWKEKQPIRKSGIGSAASNGISYDSGAASDGCGGGDGGGC